MRTGESTTSPPPLIETNALPATGPVEQENEDNVLCDIEHPVLFQAVLTRLKSMLHRREWRAIGNKLAALSPRALLVALTAGEFPLFPPEASRLEWMLRGPNPYIFKHPTMMHEVRGLDLRYMLSFPALHHLTSLRKLVWDSQVPLPDNAFSLVRQHVTGLQELHLNALQVDRPVLNDIVHMRPNLESLRLGAYFKHRIPPLGNFRGLKKLAICDSEHGRYETFLQPETLEGLTRLESLDLDAKMCDHLVMSMPIMFPLLRYLRVSRRRLHPNMMASLESMSGNKEGFELVITE